LKTAVKHLVRDNPDASKEDICASFQAAVVDSLMLKCAAGFDHMESEGTPAKAFSIGGGVAANSYLRQRAQEFARERAIDSYVPELWACTDNAAMIGVAANMRYEKYGPDDMGVSIAPSWALSDI